MHLWYCFYLNNIMGKISKGHFLKNLSEKRILIEIKDIGNVLSTVLCKIYDKKVFYHTFRYTWTLLTLVGFCVIAYIIFSTIAKKYRYIFFVTPYHLFTLHFCPTHYIHYVTIFLSTCDVYLFWIFPSFVLYDMCFRYHKRTFVLLIFSHSDLHIFLMLTMVDEIFSHNYRLHFVFINED